MRLGIYFFRQFLTPFVFGSLLFLFVLVLDKLFDLLDLIFNKGIGALIVGKLFVFIIPTVLPLTIPMACILACLVTFGRLSEENELTAVRSSGISLLKVLWLPPFFSLCLSVAMVPMNSALTPLANKAFFSTYEDLLEAEPLVNITPRNFFALRNIRIFADKISADRKELKDLFVYQKSHGDNPPERIFAKSGTLSIESQTIKLYLRAGQHQRLSAEEPQRLLHTSFSSYEITVPMNLEQKTRSTRFRNIPSKELNRQIKELRQQGFATAPMEAEKSLRTALAFAPFCLTILGIPLATSLKKGSRSFGFGVTIIMIFMYYLLLIFGLTLAEKGKIASDIALWIANVTCLIGGTFFIFRLMKR